MEAPPFHTVRPGHPSASFFSRAARNFLFSGLGTSANFITSFLFAGLTIRYLGAARSGYFMALAALTGLNAFLGDFGLGTPAVRRVALLNSKGDLHTARIVVGSVGAANLFSSLLVAIPILLFFSPLFQWSRLDPIYKVDAFWATIFSFFSFCITQSTSSWKAAYTALERYDLASGLNTGFSLLNGLCGIAVLSMSPTMMALSLVRLLLACVRMLADGFYTRRLLGGMPWFCWSWSEIRPMLSFGGWVYIGSMSNLLLSRANSLILTTYLGSAALPFYELPQRIYNQVHTALASQSQFLFPMLASYGETAVYQIQHLEDRLRWLVALTSGLIYICVATFGLELSCKVVNPEFASLAKIPLYLMCVQGFFQAQDIVPYYASYALGSGKPNSIVSLVQGLLVVSSSFLLIYKFGLVGASIAQLWVIPAVIWHNEWIHQITRIEGEKGSWLQTFTSPCLMIGVWLGLKILFNLIPKQNLGISLLFDVIALITGIAVLLFFEHFFSNSYKRLETLQRLALMPFIYVKTIFSRRVKFINP